MECDTTKTVIFPYILSVYSALYDFESINSYYLHIYMHIQSLNAY